MKSAIANIARHKWTRIGVRVWAVTAVPKWTFIGVAAAKKAGILKPVLILVGF